MTNKKTFVVLGMHRSATSFIAKALHKIGINMGDRLLGTGSHNKQGHYEDLDFLRLNRSIIKNDEWYNANAEILDHYDRQITELINKKNTKDYWGWKDPRTCLTIQKYYDKLDDPILVCLFRDPDKVADSLFERDKMPKKLGKQLAKGYNKKLIEFLTKKFT